MSPKKADDTPAARAVIAEDEAIVRLDLKEILVSAGYDVVGECGRGDEAVTLVEEHQPDLAILDIKMPGMDGLRAAREITSRHQVAVLLLTAFSQRDLIEEARDAGVSAYLVKPFQPRELLPAVADVLASARQDWAIEAEHSADGAEDKIATRRVVDEAKAILMERDDLPETEAFSFIQRTAMQTRAAHARRRPADRRRHTHPESRAMADGQERTGPLLLLDGMSLAFRAYSALPDTLATSSGVVTNAAHGFTSMLVYLIREQHPSALAVAFDAPGDTFRDDMLEDYKAGRAATPWLLPPSSTSSARSWTPSPSPSSRRRASRRTTSSRRSATQAARAGAARSSSSPATATASSSVQDPYIRVLDNKRGVSDYALYDEAGIVERTGVTPEKYVLLASLRGDPSDNLPGIPGVGEKTAAKLINKYGDLDGVFEPPRRADAQAAREPRGQRAPRPQQRGG